MKTQIQRALIASAIIILSLILSIGSFWQDSLIVDEVPHIGAGYSYLTKLDYRLNPEHPPLAKLIGATPLLFLNFDDAGLFQSASWTEALNGQWEFGRQLLFGTITDSQQATRSVKFPFVGIFALASLLIFSWTKNHYGTIGGFIALIIFAFSPTIIAHSRFVATDFLAMFGVTLASFLFLRFLHHQTRKNALGLILGLGFALLAKFSTILLIPFFIISAFIFGLTQSGLLLKQKIIRGANLTGKTILIIFVTFLIIIWPTYLVLTKNYPLERQVSDTTSLTQSFPDNAPKNILRWASDKSGLRALGHYALGLGLTLQRSEGGNTAFFLGDITQDGRKSYFPIVYLVKEPLAWWALVISALIFIGLRADRANYRRPLKLIRENFLEFFMLLWLALYWFISIRSNLNIGLRHILPIYPFTIILVAGQIDKIFKHLKQYHYKKGLAGFSLFIVGLLGWYFYENHSIYPYYLTYFNETVPQENAHEIVVDSNLDWGQDLKRLGDWLIENDIKKIDLDYFGWADPEYYLPGRRIWINSGTYRNLVDFKNHNQSEGWIGVSATFLVNSLADPEQNYGWLLNQEPVERIGNSIFIYKF
ncbi:MAG: hypothetical protein COV31_01010 [Candidatus Yanofskybacteria bacterium CG10_big_fil_rev_8_21_14_0_10_46_23]|uniref:Glycosyltransferase RgtA/B/C/D-like domain-containing protein n=1 Tax=Candidatus Yanofskybacteria bacterium CG10_big_fil_rev_8_21_14_0_10_46_23 TaxID=1975098 RepID=A0A2H0R4K4_9BACT|nr:MAG: hypothetical protein COV31_01010 [Candidatus Yanofskybacteria bacterium CG10_big_fil_rev_8_21_14_0_10_46_23]